MCALLFLSIKFLEYVMNRTHVGRSVKERELMGMWILHETDDQYSSIEYQDNHTYSQTTINHLAFPLYDGRVDFKYVSCGTWEVCNDTLYTHLQAGYQFEMDHSRIIPKPGHEKEVEECLKNWEQSGLELKKQLPLALCVIKPMKLSSMPVAIKYN